MKFKRFLSTALAAVMATSVMSIGMVNIAYAALDNVPTVAVEIGQSYDLTTKALDGLDSVFEANSAGTVKESNDKRFVTNAKVDSAGVNLKANDGYALKLLTPSDESGIKLVILDGAPNDYKVSYNSTSETSNGEAEFTTQVIPANTVVTIEGNASGSSKIKEIKVKTGAAPTAHYSVSGTVKVDGVAKEGVSVRLEGSDYVQGDNPTTTDASGKYEFKNIGNNEIVNVVIDDTDEYSSDTKEVSNPSADVTLDFDLVAFKKVESAIKINLLEGLTAEKDKEEIPNGRIIGNGYFKVVKNYSETGTFLLKRWSSNNVTSIETGKKESGNLQFVTTKPFNVTVEFSSNGSSSSSDIAIKGSSAVVNQASTTGTGHTTLIVDNLPAGTYEILSPADGTNNSRGARLYSVEFTDTASLAKGNKTTQQDATGTDNYWAATEEGNSTYIIRPVSQSEVESHESLSLGTINTKTVYDSVVFEDGSTLSATDIGGYKLFAVIVEETDGAAPTQSLQWEFDKQ